MVFDYVSPHINCKFNLEGSDDGSLMAACISDLNMHTGDMAHEDCY